MTYVDKLRVKNAVILVTLSLFFTDCSPIHEIETNVSNYKLVQTGRSKNPAVLFFQDRYCSQNDSITNWFLKNNYQVIIAQRNSTNLLFVLNTDHPLLRETDGLALIKDLNKFPISYIAASGIEVHATVNWFINTEVAGGFLFPFYKGSLKEYLIKCIYTDQPVFPDYPSSIDPTELITLLETTPAPSGTYGNYSLRFLKSIWQQQPESQLTSYEGDLVYKVVK